jgi:CBS domain-containing protein
MIATPWFDRTCKNTKPTAALLRVRDVGSWPAVTVDPDARTAAALQAASDLGIHHLLVVRGRDLLGVACTCALREAIGRAPIGEYMARGVITASPNASLSDAADLMASHGVECLPSYWRGAWGLITRGDCVRFGVMARRACVCCRAQHHIRRERSLDLCPDCLEVRQLHDPIDILYQDIGVVD